MDELLSRIITAGEEVEKIAGDQQRIEELKFDVKSLKSIIGCASEADIAKAGKNVGENNAKFYLALMNKQCSFESCYNLLTKLLGEHSNWYGFEVKESPGMTLLTLVDKNKLGKKWMTFVREYAEAMIKTMLNIEVKSTLENEHVLLEIHGNK